MLTELADYCFNTSPLNYFARVKRLDLLKTRFAGRTYVASEVITEIAKGAIEHPELTVVLEADWLKVLPLTEVSDLDLMGQLYQRFATKERRRHAGEVATIALAYKRGAQAVLDDGIARIAAQDHGIPIIGTVGLLADFVNEALLKLDTAWAVHESMCGLNPGGFRSPIKTYAEFVTLVKTRRF